MICLDTSDIRKLRNGEVISVKVKAANCWQPKQIHQIKEEMFGPAVMHAELMKVDLVGDYAILELTKSTVFEYLKRKRPDYMQMEIF